MEPRETQVVWARSADPAAPFHAIRGTDVWVVRENAYSRAPVRSGLRYSLLVNGQVVDHFDAWPERWEVPLSHEKPFWDGLSSGSADVVLVHQQGKPSATDPIGQCRLFLYGDGRALLRIERPEGVRVCECPVSAEAIGGLVTALRTMGFPAVPVRNGVAGGSPRWLMVQAGGRSATAMLPGSHHLMSVPERDFCAKIDAVVASLLERGTQAPGQA